MPRTKLDILLDAVTRRERELTFDLDGYTAEQIERVISTASARGLHAAFDGRFLLVRAI